MATYELPTEEEHDMAFRMQWPFSRQARLTRLLRYAARQIRSSPDTPYTRYTSVAALADFVDQCRREILAGTISAEQKHELWCIFAPTSDWDDVVGNVAVGNAIFALLGSGGYRLPSATHADASDQRK